MISYSLKQAFGLTNFNLALNRRDLPNIKSATLAMVLGGIPIREIFAQKVGEVYSVDAVKKIIYGEQKNTAILPYRQLQLSKRSSYGNPIYVTTDRLITASPDGKSGYSLEGNGTEPGASTLYRIYEKFGRVWAYENAKSLNRLPKLNISAKAQQARQKGSEMFFAKGYNLALITECVDDAGQITGYNEYYTKTDNEGGSLYVVKICGDEVEPTHIADKFITLPTLDNLVSKKAQSLSR